MPTLRREIRRVKITLHTQLIAAGCECEESAHRHRGIGNVILREGGHVDKRRATPAFSR
jgi:hypothetical protein